MRSRIPPTLLDRLVPRCDATRVEHRVIHAPPSAVYDAVLEADFLDAVRRSAPVRLLFGLRASLERVVAALRGRRPAAPPPPATLRLIDLTTTGEWVLLGEDPPTEIAFGVIGRFWSGETRWERTTDVGFAAFNTRGFAKIGCNFVLRPAGEGSTLLTYEARTVATDPASRRAFLRYWRVVSPFVGIVMRAQLGVIAKNVERELLLRSGASRVQERIV